MVVKTLRWMVLLILPAWMVVLSMAFKKAEGAYWESPKFDPSYSYLLGSLAYAVGAPSMCCLHPGVTVQVNGAWMLKATHTLLGYRELVTDVLTDPDVYASVIGFEETLLYGLALLIAGWIVYRATDNIEAALLIQLAPFLDLSAFHWLSPIAPEAILYALVVIAAALAATYRHSPTIWRTAILFGVLSGAGAATKITYLPAAVLPLLLLESWTARLIYLATASACFAAISVPHWATVDNAIYFWSQLLHKRGLHGSGEPGRPRIRDLLGSISDYIQSDRVYMVLLVLSIVIVVWMFFSSKRKLVRTLAILIACEALQVILASRQFNARYLSPAYGLFSANLALIYLSIRPRRWLQVTAIAAIALLTASQGYEVFKKAASMRQERARLQQVATILGSTHVVNYFGASDIPFALHFGDVWVYRRFAPQLERLYPRRIFWDAYRRNFEGFENTIALDDLCKSRQFEMRGAPFGMPPTEFSPPAGISVKELGRAGGDYIEAFYEASCPK